MTLRPLIALIGVLAVFAAVAWGLLTRVLPSGEPPQVERSQPASKALTRHLMLIVVDGLRWDVANDERRMPHLSRSMQREASGELWAGRVSMTTSAVLTLVTGQRGGFEQVVFNADPSPPRFDSWLGYAKQAGLSVMHVGDPAWTKMFGSQIDEHRLDPEGVSIDVDFNPQTFRDARELRAKRPNVLIVHFVTPDHQAHAHTVPSPKFSEHIFGFDRDLHAFLEETGPEWTIAVMGDHGAADSGTHGADVPIQRKTVLYARGPGIAAGARVNGRIDQADLPGTFAALLGLPTPAHSRGHFLPSVLDVPAETRRAIACGDAERALRVAPLLIATVVLAIAIVIGLLGTRAFAGATFGLVLCALAVLLTWGIERLPGMQPLAVRIALFVLANLLVLVLLLVPGRAARWAERMPSLAPALVPGLLVVTYTTNAQPEAYVTVVAGFVLFSLLGGFGAGHATLRQPKLGLSALEIALAVIALAVLFFPGTRTSEIVPAVLRRDGIASLAVGAALLLLLPLGLARSASERRRYAIALAGGVCAALALALRRVVPPWPGRLAIVVALAVTIVLALRGRRLAALCSGLTGFALISRDFELVALAAAISVADLAGLAVERQRRAGQPFGFAEVLLAAAFVFALGFVLRIGLQGALDFGSMDWGAAGFGDPHVPAWVIGTALGLKYVLGFALVFGAFVARLPRELFERVLVASYVAMLARGVVLTGMFLIAGDSFWTGLRVLGDLPFGFLWAATLALMWLGLRLAGRASIEDARLKPQ